jgi:ABC-type multidrug transport system fused ATPase/permease subunit
MDSPTPTENKIKVTQNLRDIVLNAGRLLRLSWRMDPYTTSVFYAISFLGALVPVVTTYLFTQLLDQIQFAQNSATTIIPIAIVSILATRSVVNLLQDMVLYAYTQTYLDHIFRYKLQNKISYDFYKKVASLDIGQFEDPKIQDLVSKVKDMMLWKIPDYVRIFSYLFGNIIAYTSAFVVTIQFGWWVPLLVTLATIPRLYTRIQYGNIQWSVWDGSAPQSRRLWYLSWILHEKTAVREMRVAQTSDTVLGMLRDLQKKLYDLNKKPLDQYMRALIAPPIVEALVLLLIALLFVPDVISNAMTIGTFSLLVSMLAQLNSNTASAAWDLSSLYENNLYVNQYFKLLRLEPRIKSPQRAVKLKGTKPPRIEFRNVSFAYEGGKNILHNVSFVIESGQSVAFVGHNGAGKSTIIKLLCRFYDVTEGEILIDGKNIKDIDLQSWYAYLGTLFQEFVWYHLTVRENITLGTRHKGTQKDIIAAARKAGAHDFIMKLPQTYDQPLGREYENGEELSGGQWQKLAIARAFYQQPHILILDEPTSAIDAEAEYEIFNNLEKQYADEKSLILVSHRFSTVRNAEKIIVLDEGKIVESGSHAGLMKDKKLYARMFLIQAEGYR